MSIVIVCAGALAAGATAATLKVHATPSKARKNTAVTVTLSGTYRRSELVGTSNKAFVVSFVQLNVKHCKADVTTEYNTGASPYFASRLSKSPFRHSDTKNGSKAATYRICAYLYAKQIKLGTSLNPLARAGTSFTITR